MLLHGFPETSRIASWTALSVPHLAAFGRAIRNDADQARRSEYIAFFMEPGLADAAFAADDFTMLRQVWNESGAAGSREYLEVFSQPGALTAALDWYRGSRGMDPIEGLKSNTSGLTCNSDTGTLFAAINRPAAIAELSTDGRLLRYIPLPVMVDSEGITHIEGELFAVSDESDNHLR